MLRLRHRGSFFLLVTAAFCAAAALSLSNRPVSKASPPVSVEEIPRPLMESRLRGALWA